MSRATSQHPPAQPSQAAQTAIPQPHWQAADLIIAYLEQLGVEYVFGVPGGAIEPLYNALARSQRRGSVRPVVARHESGAAFMADGYFRETGKLGVCCATTGPGATNLLTGVASAYENDIPLLVITGQTALPTFGRGAFQESSCTGLNTLAMFEPCTHYNTLVSHVAQLERKLATAIRAAWFGRGPVHLTLPLDVARQQLEIAAPSFSLDEYIRRPRLVDPEGMARLSVEVAQSRHPVVIIGGSCAEAIDTIMAFVTERQIPFAATPEGKGFLDTRHPLFRGVVGFGGHPGALRLLAEEHVDLVIAAGTGFSEWKSAGWDSGLMSDKLIHIADSQKQLAHSPMARLQVHGDIEKVFESLLRRGCDGNPAGHYIASEQLIERFQTGAESEAVEDDPRCVAAGTIKSHSDLTPLKPQRLMYELGRRLPSTTKFFADTGNSVAWATHFLHPVTERNVSRRSPVGNRVQLTSDFATMGWAIGSAVGCALGNRSGNVVCITGDGSFLMSGQELTVAVAEKLAVIFVVLNDSALGMVKHGQRLAGAEPVAFELPHINFAAMAQAMGANGIVIDSPQALQAVDFDALCQRAGPTVLDVRIDAEEVPPMNIRMKILQGQ